MAGQTKELLRAIPGTDNIHDDWDPEVLQISLNIDPDRANLTGITNQDVAAIVHTGFSGYSPTQLREARPVDPHHAPAALRRADALRGPDQPDGRQLDHQRARAAQPDRALQDRTGRAQDLPARPRAVHDGQVRHGAGCVAQPGRARDRARSCSRLSATWPPDYRYEFGGEKYEQQKGFASLTRGAGDLVGRDLPGAGVAVQQRHQAAGRVRGRAVRPGGRDDGAADLPRVVRLHGLSGRRLAGRRDRQPHHRVVRLHRGRARDEASRCAAR